MSTERIPVFAVDPGDTKSAFVLFDGERPAVFGKWDNHVLLRDIHYGSWLKAGRMAIETMKPRGMPTSFQEMQTQLWAGRFIEAWFRRQGGEKFALAEAEQVFRMDVKMHLCNRASAKDANIRQSLIDRFGGKDVAIGGVKCKRCKGKGWYGREHTTCPEWLHRPGPLYGIAEDCWSALAIAVYWTDKFSTLEPAQAG